jgi:hypothetical protein
MGLFSACSAHIARSIHKNYPALDNSAEVKVIKVGESIPFKYEELGSLKLGDAGMTSKSKCSYEALLALAIEEAKKVGGDAIKIVEHLLPRTEFQPGALVIHQCHSLFVLILKTDEDVDNFE